MATFPGNPPAGPYERIGLAPVPDTQPGVWDLTARLRPGTITRILGWAEQTGIPCRGPDTCHRADTVTRYRVVVSDDPCYRIWWCSVCGPRHTESQAEREEWAQRYRAWLRQLLHEFSQSHQDRDQYYQLLAELRRFQEQEGLQ